MKTKFSFRSEWLLLLFLIAPFAFIFIQWNSIPNKVPMHWNIAGEIDRYGSRGSVLYIPLLNIGIYLLMLFVPFIDPRRKNYEMFERVYRTVRIAIGILLCLLSCMIIFSSIGYSVNVGLLVMLAITCLFIVLGNLFGKIRPNYFVGVRTPWTLENEDVWMRTHRMAGKLWVFVSIGVLPLIFLIPQTIMVWLFFSYVAVIALVPVLYSWKISSKKAA
jgi:uncharacterized membrane protein